MKPRNCVVCGKQYNYCPNCGVGDPKETWRNIYCSHNCRTVFDALSKWQNKYLSSTDAAKILDECGVQKVNDHLQKIVDTIKSEAAPAVTPATTVEKETSKPFIKKGK